jgi:PPK2 family polyphosphate:nucleotide phosphotransferase
MDVTSPFQATHHRSAIWSTTVKIHCSDFRIKPGEKTDLATRATTVAPFYRSKDQYESLLQTHIEELSGLQSLLYACNRHALLVIFQAMDAAGKDGAIKHVMSGLNPQGCQVYSFKHPSAEELEHDFLWRTTRCLPERGRIGIFNRSYYEEVLIVRVHREILEAEHLPEEADDTKDFWARRFRSILDLETHLHRNGTRIVKFFLHLSPEEQRRRLLERIDDPHKNWKFSLADIEERRLWREYMKAYEECLAATSTIHAPWYVVPADDKKNTRLIVSSVLHETLRELKMCYPTVDAQQRRELHKFRKLLTRDSQTERRTPRRKTF